MKSFNCQYNPEVSLIDSCPISECWANFKSLESRCVFEYLKRNEVSIHDLAIIRNRSSKRVSKRLENERQIIADYCQLVQALDQPLLGFRCTACGIRRATSGNCLNQRRCRRRQRLYTKQCVCSPLKEFELNISPAQFFEIFTQPKFMEFLAPYCVAPKVLEQAQSQLGTLDSDPPDSTETANVHAQNPYDRPSARGSLL